jgi:transcriptional regulator with XRE-family HTH domain
MESVALMQHLRYYSSREKIMGTAQPLDFGSYVKQAREQRGHSVRHLAALMRVAPSTIGRIERNTLATPGPDLVLALINELGLDSGAAIRLLGPYQRLTQEILPTLADYLHIRYNMKRKDIAELTCHVRQLGYDPE